MKNNGNTEPPRPVRIAVNGVSGFARVHLTLIRNSQNLGRAELVGVARHGLPLEAARTILVEEGFDPEAVAICENRDDLLRAVTGECDLVTAPSPIPVHAADHAAIVRAGIPCLLEKPPTLDPEELERMIALDHNASQPTVVNFQMITDPLRRSLKQRLVAGEFGRLDRVSFIGLWRRDRPYYTRCGWAGRMVMGGQLVLDSVFGNGMSHFLHAALFWAGIENASSFAAPESARAEMYRANPIEGPDTVFAEARCTNGVALRMAASHACREDLFHEEHLDCGLARIVFHEPSKAEIEWKDGRRECLSDSGADSRTHGFQAALDSLRDPAAVRVGLGDCRSYVALNGLLYMAANQIGRIPVAYVLSENDSLIVPEISDAAREFIASGRFPSAQGRRWAHAPGAAGTGAVSALRARVAEFLQDARAPSHEPLPPGIDRPHSGEPDTHHSRRENPCQTLRQGDLNTQPN
jgi:predicted dehydrogenase